MFFVECTALTLLKIRMQFDLVDGRHHARFGNDPVDMVWIKVRHPDRLCPPLLPELHQSLPCLDEEAAMRGWPVDEVKIDIIGAEPLQAGIKGLQRLIIALVVVPELGREKDLATGDARSRIPSPTPSSFS